MVHESECALCLGPGNGLEGVVEFCMEGGARGSYSLGSF